MKPNPGTDRPERLLSWREVAPLIGMSRVTAWRRAREGLFPKPVKTSAQRTAWRESDIVAWQASLSSVPCHPDTEAA